MKLYTIKPLKWQKNILNEIVRSYWTDCGIGHYVVERRKTTNGDWGKWYVERDANEMRDEIACNMPTRAKAQKEAEWDWQKRLEEFLNRKGKI